MKDHFTFSGCCRRRTMIAAAGCVMALLAPAARAADTCKVKVDKKTGVIAMIVTGSSGLPGWRDGSSQDLVPYDYGNCVVKGDSFTCPLAAADSPLATIPPPSCTVCAEDGSGKDCCARIKGCTPGVRDCLKVTEVFVIDGATFGEAIAECPPGYRVTGGGGSCADAFDLQELRASRPLPDETGWHCEGRKQGIFPAALNCHAICCRRP